MKEILERCCGLDVHKDTVVATIMIGIGKTMQKETKTFSTMTDDLKKLKDWLKSHQITDVAMESTGIYWKPIFNILGNSFGLLLVNARHVKNVPGRKTDVSDSEWLCKLLKNGLLDNNFIPPEKIRNLRDLSRYRKKIVHMITAEKNRILKVLESANIKLGSILSDVFGVAVMAIIQDLSKGITDPKKLAFHKSEKTRASIEEFRKALTGTITPHHGFLLKTSLELISSFEKTIKDVEAKQDQIIEDYRKEIELLISVPGIQKTSAVAILSEIGNDMNEFHTANHLCSWAGVCPGNNESAGKKKALDQTREIPY
jgi:transposase